MLKIGHSATVTLSDPLYLKSQNHTGSPHGKTRNGKRFFQLASASGGHDEQRIAMDSERLSASRICNAGMEPY